MKRENIKALAADAKRWRKLVRLTRIRGMVIGPHINLAEMVDRINLKVKRPKGTVRETDDAAFYTCPQCGKETDDDGVDIMGADDGCLFCTNCHCEFET